MSESGRRRRGRRGFVRGWGGGTVGPTDASATSERLAAALVLRNVAQARPALQMYVKLQWAHQELGI